MSRNDKPYLEVLVERQQARVEHLAAPKVCLRCRETKRRGQFSPHKGYKDGHASVCRECRASEARVARAVRSRVPGRRGTRAGRRKGQRLRECWQCHKELPIGKFEITNSVTGARDLVCRRCKKQVSKHERKS